MNRKLLILDAVLLAVVVYAGVQFHGIYQEAKARAAAQRNVRVKPVPPPPAPSIPPSPPVLATNYAPIAQKLLLSKDRNPEVPVEETPPPPPPPPPPPMPALPLYHGIMDFGDQEGPIAIMSLAAKLPHKAIHPGEMIGEFKLLAVSKDGIDLQWRDQTVHKKLEEVMDRSHDSGPQQKAQAPAAASIAEQQPPAPAGEHGPGAEAGAGIRRCIPGDTTPVGTERDGYRKIIRQGPFGPACYWEAIGAH